MKVNSVQNTAHLYYRNIKPNNKTNVTNPVIENKVPISDTYGRAMLSFQAGRAKNIKHLVMKAPLEEKMSAVLNSMQFGEVLIVSKNLKTSLEQLKENIRAIDFPIRKIFHIHNPHLEESLVLSKLDDFWNVRFFNINDEPVELYDLGIPLVIDPAENQVLGLGGTINSSIGAIQIINEPESVRAEDLEAYMPVFVDEIYYTNQLQLSTILHNKQILVEEHDKQEIPTRGPLFKDVGGQDDVIEKLEDQMLLPFMYPEVYAGIMPALGAILYGEPGTGKTFLADAFANEANAYKIRKSGTEFGDSFVGGSEKNIRKMFAEAVENQPSVIILDEFDALARSRGRAGNIHADNLLNEFLKCTSDLQTNGDKVAILASTNRLEDLDPAVLRSGRFDLHLEVKKPDLASTKKILQLKTKSLPMSKQFDYDKIAQIMFDKGLTGADIYRVVRDAHKIALKRTGIRTNMKNKTYNPLQLKSFYLMNEDFEIAINDFKPEEKARKRIGF